MFNLPLQLLLLLLTSTTTTSAIPSSSSSRLFLRQDTCVSGFDVCGGDLPSNFCCPTGTKCLSLAGDTTVLCCPEGKSCDKIETVPCDVDEMDPEKNPDAPIKTSVLGVALETCGDSCCPFGYGCNSSGQCQMKRDQSKAPEEDKPSSTTTTSTKTEEPTSAPDKTESGAPEATTTGDPASSDGTGDETKDSGPNTAAIVGGVVGGCAILLIAAIALLCLVRRRNRQGGPSSSSSSSGSPSEKARSRGVRTRSAGFSNIISDPISQGDQYRTDFILHPPPSSSSFSGNNNSNNNADRWLDRQPSNARTPPVRPPRVSIPNPFNSPNPSVAGSATSSRASTASSGFSNATGDIRTGQVARGGARLAPIRSMKASSRHLKPSDAYAYGHGGHYGNRSAESIDVFADPRAVERPDTRQTTFTDLMDEADLSGVGKDRPFVQVPGTTPRI